jgi:hypothetical protein
MTSILTRGIVDHLDNAFRIAVDFSAIERTHTNGHFNGRHFDLINGCNPNGNNHSPAALDAISSSDPVNQTRH